MTLYIKCNILRLLVFRKIMGGVYMHNKVLIVEDDSDIVELLRLYLESNNYITKDASDGIVALNLLKEEEFDIALVDIMLPKMDGYSLIKEVRKFSNIPIIIISAKTADMDKVLGLKLGADAYITKPFNPLEVIAYVEAILRRFLKLGTGVLADVYKVGNLSLEMDKYILRKEEEIIPLTSTEMKMMVMFMQNPNRVFTKSQIYEYINGDYCDSDDNTMMVHISNLRSKIESDPANPKYILTVRGLGYKLVAYEEK